MTWIVFAAIVVFGGCHSRKSIESEMPENRIFTITAEIVDFRQQDLSKMKGRVLMYSYIDLMVQSAVNNADPKISFPGDTISITRPAEKGDENLEVGMIVRVEIGVDKLEKPQQYYWMRRLE